mgnify:CR=1 FL=1
MTGVSDMGTPWNRIYVLLYIITWLSRGLYVLTTDNTENTDHADKTLNIGKNSLEVVSLRAVGVGAAISFTIEGGL